MIQTRRERERPLFIYKMAQQGHRTTPRRGASKPRRQMKLISLHNSLLNHCCCFLPLSFSFFLSFLFCFLFFLSFFFFFFFFLSINRALLPLAEFTDGPNVLQKQPHREANERTSIRECKHEKLFLGGRRMISHMQVEIFLTRTSVDAPQARS